MDYCQKAQGPEDPGRRDGRVCHPQNRSFRVFNSKDGESGAQSQKGNKSCDSPIRTGIPPDLKPLQVVELVTDRGIEFVDVPDDPNRRNDKGYRRKHHANDPDPLTECIILFQILNPPPEPQRRQCDAADVIHDFRRESRG